MDPSTSPAQTLDDPDALSRVVAVINGKGGVLKTSIVANVAGCLAAAGHRVLVIDVDVSGNLKLDFGLGPEDGDDAGKALVDAVWYARRLAVVPDVRPGLDFVFGGHGLEMLGQMARTASADQLPTGSVAGEFAERIAEVSENYDIILLDCPPGNGELQEMALAASRWVLVPTKTDQASWDGLLGVGPRVRRARRTNPDLDYLGVVITAHNPSATRVKRETAKRLTAEVGEKLPLLSTVIRHSESAAHDCRSRGQLAHELARDVVASKGARLSALSARRLRKTARGEDNVIELPTNLSDSADSLAGDYKALAREIVERIAAVENAAAAAEGAQ